MRCNDCNKFVSFDPGTEPECDDLELSVSSQTPVETTAFTDAEDNTGICVHCGKRSDAHCDNNCPTNRVTVELDITGSARMVNNCSECSAEIAECNVELAGSVEIVLDARDEDYTEDDFEVEVNCTSRDEELKVGRRGKPIKEILQVCIVEYTITGPDGSTVEGELRESASGSDFEDCQ